jgi:hypothetical protein
VPETAVDTQLRLGQVRNGSDISINGGIRNCFVLSALKTFQECQAPSSYRCLSVPTVEGRGNFQIFFFVGIWKGHSKGSQDGSKLCASHFRMNLRLSHAREIKILGFLAELFDRRPINRIGDCEAIGGSINIWNDVESRHRDMLWTKQTESRS